MNVIGYLLLVPVGLGGAFASRLEPRVQTALGLVGVLSAIFLFLGSERLISVMALGFSVALLVRRD